MMLSLFPIMNNMLKRVTIAFLGVMCGGLQLLVAPSAFAGYCSHDVPTGYKCGLFDEERPQTWSAVLNGEIIPVKMPRPYRYPGGDGTFYLSLPNERPFYSISSDIVAYGDMNWHQLDFFLMSGNNLDRYQKLFAKYNKRDIKKWSTVVIDGQKALVAEQNLDDGVVDKGGPGGKFYFIPWSYTVADGQSHTHTYKAGLLIWKQALGEKDFEQGTDHILSTLSLHNITNAPYEDFLVK